MAAVFTALAFVVYKIDWVRIYTWLQDRIDLLPKIGDENH